MRLGWAPPLPHALCHSLIRPAVSSAWEEVGLGVTSRKGGRWSNPCAGSQGADVRGDSWSSWPLWLGSDQRVSGQGAGYTAKPATVRGPQPDVSPTHCCCRGLSHSL